MDVVNKWLLMIGCFFTALIITLGWTSGSGKYSVYVTDSPYVGYQMVYVVNTRSGEVKAKMHSIDEHVAKNSGKVKDYLVDVVKDANPNKWGYKYDYDNPPVRKNY